MKKFNILNVSSKFAICGLPLRADTYKTCSFGCKYCFSNNREIMKFEKELQIGNINKLKKQLENVKNNKYKDNDFLMNLLADGITWHCGGMSDPFQPAEKTYKITEQMINLANINNISITFSTKSDTVYDCDIRPDLHSFQMSITNIEDRRDIEPNVPSISKRYNFYKYLKNNGFKVGIRVQPFIPNISNIDIIDMFNDADYFTIEGLKIVPQNKSQKEYIVDLLNINLNDFKQMGLLNLKPEIRESLYKPFIERLNYYKIPYSIADNDMHYNTKSKCCCGEILVNKSTSFNNTAMLYKYGDNYSLEQVKNELGDYSVCKANHLFTSNRQEGCVTVEEFYDKRFDRKTSPFSPKYSYKLNNK